MRKFMQNEDGQGMVEYALIIALISIAAIVVLGLLGSVISKKFAEVSKTLQEAGNKPAAGTT